MCDLCNIWALTWGMEASTRCAAGIFRLGHPMFEDLHSVALGTETQSHQTHAEETQQWGNERHVGGLTQSEAAAHLCCHVWPSWRRRAAWSDPATWVSEGDMVGWGGANRQHAAMFAGAGLTFSGRTLSELLARRCERRFLTWTARRTTCCLLNKTTYERLTKESMNMEGGYTAAKHQGAIKFWVHFSIFVYGQCYEAAQLV